MRSDETVCYVCNSPVPERHPKRKMADHLRIVVNALLIFVGVLTIGSLFSDLFPSFTKCIGLLAVLVLVKKSADTMSEFSKDR